ncbi:MAG: hypothetical protein ACI8R4_004378 [Paracoccaceae bacterium]|jgi:hypothetical protein
MASARHYFSGQSQPDICVIKETDVMRLKSQTGPVSVTVLCTAMMVTQPAQAGNESRSHAFAMADGLIEVVADFSENSIYWCGAG